MFTIVQVLLEDENFVGSVVALHSFETKKDAEDYITTSLKLHNDSIKARWEYVNEYVKGVEIPDTVKEFNQKFNLNISIHNTKEDLKRVFPYHLFNENFKPNDLNYNLPKIYPFDSYNLFIVEIPECHQ